MSANKNHDDITRRIWHNPEVIGLHNIVLSVREPNMIKPNGDLYHQPDNLCFDPSTKTLYNIEYKTRGGTVKAYFQLIQQESWLHQMFPDYKIKNLYVHDDLKVEQVKKKHKF